MNVTEVKKIELSNTELLDIIRKGLGVGKWSDLKLSFKIPSQIKVSIETVTDNFIPSGKILRGQQVKDDVIDEQPKEKKTIHPDSRVCGNCSYPYELGDGWFCDTQEKVVASDYSCRSFEFRPKIK